MSNLYPVNAWDMKLAVASETTFGTTPTPADAAAYKARFLECISASLGGAAQVGVTRTKSRSMRPRRSASASAGSMPDTGSPVRSR